MMEGLLFLPKEKSPQISYSHSRMIVVKRQIWDWLRRSILRVFIQYMEMIVYKTVKHQVAKNSISNLKKRSFMRCLETLIQGLTIPHSPNIPVVSMVSSQNTKANDLNTQHLRPIHAISLLKMRSKQMALAGFII